MAFTQRLKNTYRSLSSKGQEGSGPSFEFPKTGEYPEELLIRDEDWSTGDIQQAPRTETRAIGRFPVRAAVHDLTFMHDPPQELPQYPIPTPITSSTLYQSNNSEQSEGLQGR